MIQLNLQRFRPPNFETMRHTQPAKPAGINETQFSARDQFHNCMSVFWDFGIGRRHDKAPSHSQVNNPLSPGFYGSNTLVRHTLARNGIL